MCFLIDVECGFGNRGGCVLASLGLIAIATYVVVFVFGHAQDNKRCQRLMEITPVTLESRADHTYRV